MNPQDSKRAEMANALWFLNRCEAFLEECFRARAVLKHPHDDEPIKPSVILCYRGVQLDIPADLVNGAAVAEAAREAARQKVPENLR